MQLKDLLVTCLRALASLLAPGIFHCTLDMHSHLRLLVSLFGLRVIAGQGSKGVSLASLWNEEHVHYEHETHTQAHSCTPPHAVVHNLSFSSSVTT